jgi:hypothetical protein
MLEVTKSTAEKQLADMKADNCQEEIESEEKNKMKEPLQKQRLFLYLY